MPLLSTFKKPLAIAMWDFSWMLRHRKGDSFEDFETVIGDLVERGYNAVRIDAFPQLIASDGNGKQEETFNFTKGGFGLTMWGNNFTVRDMNPRIALKEFMQVCEKKGVYVGLSTWFFGDDAGRHKTFQGIDAFVRAWDETLTFLKEENLLNNVIYVDLLNEYPCYHGFEWMEKSLDLLKYPEEEGKKYNQKQIAFYNNFITECLQQLKAKWQGFTFFASQTEISDVDWLDVDFKEFMAIDKHIWACLLPGVTDETNYWEGIFTAKGDAGFEDAYKKIMERWTANREKFKETFASFIKLAGDKAKELNVPVGNTEGWGSINWYDHPDLDWEWIKDSAEIAVDACLENAYTFICTSNFTHPHFDIWNDIEWHKKICEKIKNGVTFNNA